VFAGEVIEKALEDLAASGETGPVRQGKTRTIIGAKM
jgi:hypothetical protein